MPVAEIEPGPAARRKLAIELAAYVAVAFAITWGLGAAMVLARPQLEAVVGPIVQVNQHWLYYVAICAPSIAAIVCSLRFGGWSGLKALGARLVRPVRPLWVVVAILFWPLLLAAYALAAHTAGQGQVDLHALAFGMPVVAFTTWVLFADPAWFGEEFGWRGFALPRLLRLWSPATASVVLGLIWGLWHLPGFFISGLAQRQFGLAWFLVGCVAECIVWTWLYLHANGNLIVAGMIPHLMWNLVFDAHVLSGDVIRVEFTPMILLAVVLLAVLGPGLRGWKPRAQTAQT